MARGSLGDQLLSLKARRLQLLVPHEDRQPVVRRTVTPLLAAITQAQRPHAVENLWKSLETSFRHFDDELLEQEPVHIVKNNRPMYVVLREEDYQAMLADLALARIEESEADVRAGRVRKGTTADLMAELDSHE